MSVVGSQMRVAPEALSTSTRVVTSNVRHWSIVVPLAKSRPTLANARLVEKTPVDRRNSRRFIGQPFEPEILFLLPARRIAYTRLAP